MPEQAVVTPESIEPPLPDSAKMTAADLPDGASLAPDASAASPEPPKPEEPKAPQLPLFMCDSRFRLLERKLLADFQNKFVKFFKKLPSGHSYKSNQEIAAWLASFVYQNLCCTHEAFKTGPEDLQVFSIVFNALVSKSDLLPKAKTAEEVAGAIKEAADPAIQPQDILPAASNVQSDDVAAPQTQVTEGDPKVGGQ
jgi:hypothetical protein